jgi:DNA-binding GntR family transcriptional regulator
VREKFAVRAILEPAALRASVAHIDYGEVERVRARLADGEELGWERLEDTLMERCIAKSPNTELVQLIRNNQLLLSAASQALNRLGLPRDRLAHGEYHTLFDLLARHLVDSAAAYLESHLRVMADKNLARLKIVAVIDQPTSIAPYLTPK